MQNNPPENSSLVNICLIPSEEVRSQCLEMGQILKSDNKEFVVDDKKNIVHMTLYMARFSDDQIEKIIKVMTEDVIPLIKLKKPVDFSCRHSGYFLTEGGYLEVSYRNSQDVSFLQREVMVGLKQYRLNPEKPYQEKYFPNPVVHPYFGSIRDTGYDLAYELFRPHITLVKYKERQVPDVFPTFITAKLSFSPHRLAVCKANEDGAVYEILKEFKI